MSTPDEARFDLRAWFHDSEEVCEHDTYGTDVVMPCAVMAEHLSAALTAQGFAIVRSDDLAGLRAFVEYVAAQNPTSSRNTDGRPGWGYPVVNDIVNRARAALEGVSR